MSTVIGLLCCAMSFFFSSLSKWCIFLVVLYSSISMVYKFEFLMHAAYNESPFGKRSSHFGKLCYCNNWEDQNPEQPQYYKIIPSFFQIPMAI